MELPTAATGSIEGKEKLRQLVTRRNLTSAANDTKWDELINHFRSNDNWFPSYRYKHIGGYVSDWDCEWFYHLPFPFICVEWMDIGMYQDLTSFKYRPNKTIDHTSSITELIHKIGFEYDVKLDVVRIWGYLPKYDWELSPDPS